MSASLVLFEAALRQLLLSSEAVTAITPTILPLVGEGIRPPCILYEVRSADDNFTRDGYSGLFERGVTINCIGTHPYQAVQLAEAVKAALPLWTAGTVSGVAFHLIQRDGERDYLASEKGTAYPVGRQLDLTIKFSTPTTPTTTEAQP